MVGFVDAKSLNTADNMEAINRPDRTSNTRVRSARQQNASIQQNASKLAEFQQIQLISVISQQRKCQLLIWT